MRGVWNNLLKFAALRPRSIKEIDDWCQRKKVAEEEKETYKQKLIELELLNDKDFAKWFTESRMNFRPRSRMILTYELASKGISKEITNEVLMEANFDELEMAKAIIQKNEFRWENVEIQKRREKRVKFLQRQGFGWDIIKKIVV